MPTSECPSVADLVDYMGETPSADGTQGALDSNAVQEITHHVASCGVCKTAIDLSKRADGPASADSWVAKIVNDIPETA